ncbi:MAG: ABC transporter permease [Streptosporangiales bacterium]|nr:ABC transporter permease [Streptosporangiales bacterium]
MTGARALAAACRVEAGKLRHSRAPVLSAAGIALAPVMTGVFVVALRAPRRSSELVAGKADLFGAAATWPGFVQLLLTVYVAGGLVVTGVVSAWIFGREFSDRTAADLLATPVSRSAIVTAKFAVTAVWCAVLAAVVLAGGLLVGAVLGLPGWTDVVVVDAAAKVAAVYAFNVLLTTPIAFAASAGRGYLPAVGLVMVLVVLAQTLAMVGAGTWFPWSVPAFATGVVAPDAGTVGPVGYLLVGLVAVAGAGLTAAWWQRADHR